jgi:hypothetical protein
MADHQLTRTYDLGPSVTSALGAAYDNILPSLASDGVEFLRFSLARQLMNAAFTGERDPGRLRECASAFVRNCLNGLTLTATCVPTTKQRRTDCIRKAYELARSGSHTDPLAIETALAPTFPDARECLGGSFLRDNLRQVCELAREERQKRS